jgi:tight adherence protein B
MKRQEHRLDEALNKQLVLQVDPRLALGLAALVVVGCGLVAYLLLGSYVWFLVGLGVGLAIPHLVVSHLEQKRRQRLDEQIVDGIVTLASGVRAGLNLVQSMQLLVKNGHGPIRQEFEQLLNEYELGVDLHQAMRNASNRIGSSYYRLLFGAIEAHRERGGDMGESLDRIADSIREIQRLEGRLEALTAQGRAQARMIAAMPLVIAGVLYVIAPEDTSRLFTDDIGRLLLLLAAGLIVLGFLWIRRIMQVDI